MQSSRYRERQRLLHRLLGFGLDPDQVAEVMADADRLAVLAMHLRPIAGAAPNLLAGLQIITAPVNLSSTVVQVGTTMALTGTSQPPPAPTPWAIGFASFGAFSAVAAGATISVALQQSAAIGTNIIGNAGGQNTGTGAGIVGSVIVLGPVVGAPPNLLASALVTSGTATAVASAAEPILFGALSLV